MWKSKKMLPRDEITHEREPDVTAFAAVATKLLFLLDKNFLIFWLNSWSSTGWLPPDRSISLFRGKKYWLIFFGRFYGFFIFAVVLGPFLRVNHFFVTLPTLATVVSSIQLMVSAM
jgi:hypothetical protein